MHRLPAFSNLLAFDAAARHGAFTRAASELNVSQPAVSRRVKALEDDLGTLLFDRSIRPLRLTAEGAELFDVLRGGLSRIETVISNIRVRRFDRKFTIAAAPGFLSYWLLPRLPQLRQSFPELDFRIITGDQFDGSVDSDIHIRFGQGDWPDTRNIPILYEKVFPVCSPLYLEERGSINSVDDLIDSRLLQLTDETERWYDWHSWTEEIAPNTVSEIITTDFDSYATLISATLAGQGIALGWAGLLDPFLETGALQKVLDITLGKERGYYLTYDISAYKSQNTADIIANMLAGLE